MELPLPKYGTKTTPSAATNTPYPVLADPIINQNNNSAVNLIRHKLDQIYAKEPDAALEIAEAESAIKPSKHQKFVDNLVSSGRNLAEIQTAWHNYYIALPETEKHAVWREFYEQQNRIGTEQSSQTTLSGGRVIGGTFDVPGGTTKHDTAADIKSKFIKKFKAASRKGGHLRSMLFGLCMGSLFLLVFMFSFFNERFIAPFLQPSRTVNATPIIITDQNANVPLDPKVIIPKIGVEAPVVYNLVDNQESTVQKGLESGVIHYPTTALPGSQGNAVYFGHSSNNIFNPGKHKFVFVRLNDMQVGDTFILNYSGKRYQYRVFNIKIVNPDAVSVLSEIPKPAMATLITCDPPGTVRTRLIVQGEQISPDPANNQPAAPTTRGTEPIIIPSYAPSLWSRLFRSVF